METWLVTVTHPIYNEHEFSPFRIHNEHEPFRKVQLVTSKLDQAHGKAREIEAIVIASIAFDNRFCHALTLNRFTHSPD